MGNAGIYRIKNEINGKIYIGSAVNVKYRISAHKHYLRKNGHDNNKLQNSWNKYGEENFSFKKIIECKKEDLLFYEQLLIDGYNAVEKGLNILSIAGNSLGFKHSAESRAKMSAIQKGRKCPPRTEEHRKNISLARTGKKRKEFSEEWKQNISNALREVPRTQEWKDNISKANMGKKHTEETLKKMSILQKGKKRNPESIAKSAATRTGKKRGKYKTTGKYTYRVRKKAVK